jgi:hypothetical protein
LGLVVGQQLPEGNGTVDMVPAIVHFNQELQVGEAVLDPIHPIAQRGVEEDDFGIGVVQQIGQLIIQVAVIDVDRAAPVLERAELGQQVLG